MKQTEIIAQLRSLRESQAGFARTNGDEIFKRDVEALDAAIKALERIRWRKVVDKMPEDGKEVLCWYEYFRYGNYNRMFQTYGIGQCYNKMWCGEVANGIRARVIAWMPLPEPPKGESNG